MSIIGSVILYGARNMAYIDCLFLAAGGATQSGLNTLNLNDIYTYQQIVLLIIPSICNPIVINTFVVFVRLFWFEKRFQHIVRQANEFRRHRTRSRTKTEERRDPDFDREERGVGDRQINVLRNDTGLKVNGGDESASPKDLEPPSAIQRDIVWEDEVQSSTRDIPNEDRIPEQRSPEQHMAIVENQRHPQETGALRIPGPREWDRGDLPQRVEENEIGKEISRQLSADVGQRGQVDIHSPGEINSHGLHNILSMARKGQTPEDASGPAPNVDRRARPRTRSLADFLSQSRQDEDPIPYLSYAPAIGRNSLFVDLTEEQREELGGIEYRSLQTLAWVLILYFFGWSAFGIILHEAWIQHSPYHKNVIRSDGQGVPWWGIFTPMSAFTDLGFTLTPDSMMSFDTAVLPLLIGGFLIVIGNTAFPCMLRLIIWLGSRFAPYGSSMWEEFRFLLDHPRRCFTLLFPRKATWWLFGILIILNGIDLIFYIILDLNDSAVTSVSPGYQFLDGLFQAVSTRTAGFAVVNLAALHPAIQVSYLIMMYISVYPIAISVRQTNVYEEKSLGVYPDFTPAEDNDDDDDNGSGRKRSYLGSHLRRQLSFDLWYVFLGLFLVCIIEGDRIQDPNEPDFTIFACLFEIVSAYGTVGLSLGYPGIDASFSAEFRVLSKLIIVAMMLRGRHRGLPYALDRAILLPSESLERKDRENAERLKRVEELRRLSVMSIAPRDERDGAAPAVTSGAESQDLAGSTPALQASRSRRQSIMTVDSKMGRSTGRRRSLSRPIVPVQTLSKVIAGALSAGPGYSEKKRA